MSKVVAIDGPSGSGKSTLAKSLAREFGLRYLDTGALYRAVSWALVESGFSQTHRPDPSELATMLPQIAIDFSTSPDDSRITVNGEDVEREIRGDQITQNVSWVSAIPEVRAHLLKLQRDVISTGDIVVEGRDIGAVVAPDAELKIFLTADSSVRASRRAKENHDNALGASDVADVAQMLLSRDLIDSNRTTSPMTKADDAIELDASELDLEDVVEAARILMFEAGFQKQIDYEVTAETTLPVVAVLGRPNVGKSTLVNRIIGRREAVVEDQPGVTRDRVIHDAEWNGKKFRVMDTGGWEPKGTGMQSKVTAQAELALQHCDVAIFVVDVQVGALDEDELIVKLLRKSGKPVVLIANKVDGLKDESDASALWNLGLGEPHPVSALHGRGSGDALDFVVELLPKIGNSRVHSGLRRIALVGKPNVGKSSLLNKLAESERVVVDDQAGTTRDPVDEVVEIGGKNWQFVDTAGIRRRPNQQDGVDFYAALRTQVAIERSEVAAALIDASQPLTEQDLRILSLIEESGRALVLIFNKWDLVDEDRRLELEREIDRELIQFGWAERVNISAKTGWHKDRLVPALERALSSWENRIPTGKLNAFLGQLVSATPPPVRGGKQPRILYASQIDNKPPRFVIFATGFLEAGYRRFIERRLREEYGFAGSPIEISVKVRERN